MSNLNQLRERLRGDNVEPWFIIRRGHKICALCLRKDLNPKVCFSSVEVWVDTGPTAAEWGERLAAEKMVLPVFTAEHEEGDYKCFGHYYVQPRTHTPHELSAAEKQASHSLSRIVFLER